MIDRRCLIVAALAMAAQLCLAAPASASEPASAFLGELAEAAFEQTKSRVIYDPAYVDIDYPGGDVPANRGVCTDVVIRAYRVFGIDLQVLVHEDMRANFKAYPNLWGFTKPDHNIDHRRVPNLRVFFTRHGERLKVSEEGADYRPGDLVTFLLPNNLPHIGIVSARMTRDGARPLIIHNIGAGPQIEDMLFDYPITGHYRYPAAAEAE